MLAVAAVAAGVLMVGLFRQPATAQARRTPLVAGTRRKGDQTTCAGANLQGPSPSSTWIVGC
jgi:hypothetical protein